MLPSGAPTTGACRFQLVATLRCPAVQDHLGVVRRFWEVELTPCSLVRSNKVSRVKIGTYLKVSRRHTSLAALRTGTERVAKRVEYPQDHYDVDTDHPSYKTSLKKALVKRIKQGYVKQEGQSFLFTKEGNKFYHKEYETTEQEGQVRCAAFFSRGGSTLAARAGRCTVFDAKASFTQPKVKPVKSKKASESKKAKGSKKGK